MVLGPATSLFPHLQHPMYITITGSLFLGSCLVNCAGWVMLPGPTAVQHLSAEFSVWPCWLYHTALTPCISWLLQHMGQQGALCSLCLGPCWVLKEVEGKDVCLRYLKILPFWNTIRCEKRHLFWKGSFAGFVWSVFVLSDMSEKGEGSSCSKESIHVKQSATGSSQGLATFTHFSKSETALSLTSVWFKLG